MSAVTADQEVAAVKFFLSMGGETKLQKGDVLLLLSDDAPSNLCLERGGGNLMAIRSGKGELPITGSGKVFSRDEARMFAIGLAVGSGLSLLEEEKESSVYPGRKNVAFCFV